MAGFKRKRRVYKLDFAETDYDGLEVNVSGLTTGEYLDFVTLNGAVNSETGGNDTEGMLRMLSRHIISWNLEDEDDAPVPTSFEGLKTNEIKMNTMIIDAWIAAISDIPSDAEKKSSPGDTALVESIPTEML